MFFYQDQVLLNLLSGHGGAGALSFHRTKTNPRGGPDGGDGGDGGDIILFAHPRFKDLSHFRRKRIFKAVAGDAGSKQRQSGAKGANVEIGVPLGTVVRDEDNSLILDLKKESSLCFLQGGRGGKGNAFFANSLNQAPRHFQKGMPGIEKKVKLEFKPLIDVALIGKPNAGKSTFLNAITRAQSPVASYPYTTLSPYLGQAQDSYFIIDIPGLTKGSSQSVSKGLCFLRMIQRSSLLLHFIDVASLSFEDDKTDLEDEIKNFDKKFSEETFGDLAKKKRFLILSKSDQMTSKQLEEFSTKINSQSKEQVFKISCKKKQGIKELLIAIKKEISK